MYIDQVPLSLLSAEDSHLFQPLLTWKKEENFQPIVKKNLEGFPK